MCKVSSSSLAACLFMLTRFHSEWSYASLRQSLQTLAALPKSATGRKENTCKMTISGKQSIPRWIGSLAGHFVISGAGVIVFNPCSH